MKKTIFTALLDQDGADVELEVTTLLADQMKAELEIKKRGLSAEGAGINFVCAIAWCALVRTGQVTDKLEQFAARCYDIKKSEVDQDVDPSQSAASTDSA